MLSDIQKHFIKLGELHRFRFAYATTKEFFCKNRSTFSKKNRLQKSTASIRECLLQKIRYRFCKQTLQQPNIRTNLNSEQKK